MVRLDVVRRGGRRGDRRGRRRARATPARIRRAADVGRVAPRPAAARAEASDESASSPIRVDRRGPRRAGRRRRAGAERVPVEPRVLFHAVAGDREGSAASAAVSHRRPRRKRQPEARSEFADRAVSRDRHRADDSRHLHRAASRPLQGRQGRRRAGIARRRRRVPRDRSAREARRELHAARSEGGDRPGAETLGDVAAEHAGDSDEARHEATR